MIFAFCLLMTVVFSVVLYESQSYIILMATLVLSIFYYGKQTISSKADPFLKILTGDLPHQILYIIWLYFFPKNQFMYYIPLLLSNAGKLQLFWNNNGEDSQTIAQQLILFQTKTEAFILVTLCLTMISPSGYKLLQLLAFAIICKLKYSFYFPAQKSYVQLHFSFDNLTKRIGGRSAYHIISQLIKVFDGVYSKDRQIRY